MVPVEARAGRPAIIYDSIFLEHDTGDHPERAERLVRILAVLRERGLLDELETISPQPVTLEWLTKVHTPEYVRFIEEVCARGGGLLSMDPTPVSKRSYAAALFAAGAGLRAVDLLFATEPRPSFALVRPPGHHAEPSQALGFCIFNNIAVAATYALQQHGAERVLIVDFDVHHGNGTQDIFYEDGRVLYFSVHESPLYPGTGFVDEIGAAAGRGATVNVPLPPGTGDDGYAAVFAYVLAPVARRYGPAAILVSAGFDGHWRDPLASMELSVAGFAALVGAVKGLADELCAGRLAFLLEGGYDLDALGYAVAATIDTLMKRPIVDPIGPSPRRGRVADVSRAIAAARRAHAL